MTAASHMLLSLVCLHKACNMLRLCMITGGLMNWRVWYLGLVWLLMESALFGIIFW